MLGLILFFVDLGITEMRPQFIAWYSSAAFVFLSFWISLMTIWAHLANYWNPYAQRYVIRILVLVPLYSVQSWLSLRFHDQALFFGAARDCYEAYVIYCFFAYLINIQGGEDRLRQVFNLQPTKRVSHPAPIRFFIKPWIMGTLPVRLSSSSSSSHQCSTNGIISTLSSSSMSSSSSAKASLPPSTASTSAASNPSSPLPTSAISSPCTLAENSGKNGTREHELKPKIDGVTASGDTDQYYHHNIRPASPFLAHCQAGVWQYVSLKIVLTIISFMLESMGLFGEGEFKLSRGWIYISGLTNSSQMWAMYCLVRFYSVCVNDLKKIRPIGKLLAVKSVVFFTYSQSCVIQALVWFDFLPQAIEEGGEHWSTEDVGRGLQDYLICIEMLIAAIVFSHVFSYHDYRDGNERFFF